MVPVPDNGSLLSVEKDPLFAAIATKIVEYAGLVRENTPLDARQWAECHRLIKAESDLRRCPPGLLAHRITRSKFGWAQSRMSSQTLRYNLTAGVLTSYSVITHWNAISST